MEIKKLITVPVLTIGVTSIVAQIVILRELIVVFYGNEISVGIMLATWLIMGAAGSLLLGSLADKIKNRIAVFCACQLFLAVILPALILLIRNIKGIFNFLPGEIIPLGALALSAPVMLAPICITLGFLFALSCRIYPAQNAAIKIGDVYVLESVGAAVGGLLTSFFLLKYFNASQILAGLGIVNLLACILLLNIIQSKTSKNIIRALSYTWAAIMVFFMLTNGPARLEEKSRSLEYRPLNVIASKNSIYGNVTVTKEGSSYSFFANGLHNFTMPDRLSQEEAVHFSLLEHREPKEILLIGGGAGGLLWEILKYPVKKIDYVELDPLIIKLARKYLARFKYYALDNPRVNIINTDGRFFIKNRSLKYDVIIVNIPDPHTAQLNRFYSKEFYREARRIMKEDALLSFGVTSSENYISKELGRFLSSIYNTLKDVFADVIYIPGDTAYFIASRKKGLLTNDCEEIVRRLKERNIKTDFVNEHYLFSKLSKERLDYMKNTLQKHADEKKNFDFTPISYYYDMILWSTYFGSWLRKIPQFLNQKIIWGVFILLYALILITGWLSKESRRGRLRSTLMAIGTTGFSEIVFEIVVILSFQIIYGYLYYKIGLILTSFMIGLFLGSIYITKRLDEIRDHFGVFKKIQISVTLYPLLLPFIFLFITRSDSLKISWLGANIIFPFMPIIAGFIGGLQFPLGNKIYLSNESLAGKVGGLTYGIDLIGASLGAAIVSAFLIPIIGIFQTCIAVGLLNFSVLLSLSFHKEDLKI